MLFIGNTFNLWPLLTSRFCVHAWCVCVCEYVCMRVSQSDRETEIILWRYPLLRLSIFISVLSRDYHNKTLFSFSKLFVERITFAKVFLQTYLSGEYCENMILQNIYYLKNCAFYKIICLEKYTKMISQNLFIWKER